MFRIPALAALLSLSLAGAAGAEEVRIAGSNFPVAVTAHGDLAAWSVEQEGVARLALARGDRIATSPVAAAETVFDVDLGPRDGSVSAVFSRCALGRSGGGLDPGLASRRFPERCGVRLADLGTGSERRLARPPRGHSDVLPVLWEDRAVFFRLRLRSAQGPSLRQGRIARRPRIMWTSARTRRTQPVPVDLAAVGGRDATAPWRPVGADRDARRVAFTVAARAPRGRLRTQVWVADLRTGRLRRLMSRSQKALGAPSETPSSYRQLSAPRLAGRAVMWTEWGAVNRLWRHDLRTRRTTSRPFAGSGQVVSVAGWAGDLLLGRASLFRSLTPCGGTQYPQDPPGEECGVFRLADPMR